MVGKRDTNKLHSDTVYEKYARAAEEVPIPGATPTESDQIRPNPTEFTTTQNPTKSDRIWPNPTKSDQVRPNPTKSDQFRQSPTKSDRIYPT